MGMNSIARGKDRLPVLLGGLGAVPFIAGAVYAVFGPRPDPALVFGMQLYGAVVLSFLGGILWGRAVAAQDNQRVLPYLASILPVALGWVAVTLRPDYAFGLLALSFIGLRLVEMRLAALPAAHWFAPLRNVLTILAGLSLAVMALAL